MSQKPEKAFILAAGMGSRLRPYTDSMPKPMVEIAGKSIIYRTIEKLVQESIMDIVVNTHYLAAVVEDHLKMLQHLNIIISREDNLLDTGGGVKKMLHFFEEKPFYLINGDALWADNGSKTALSRLSDYWDQGKMDILLLLQHKNSMSLTHGVGDYTLQHNGQATRSEDKSGNYMFAGVRIVHPRIFENTSDGAFSFLTLMDKAQQKGRLYGIVHQGDWHHISTPEDLERVDGVYRAESL